MGGIPESKVFPYADFHQLALVLKGIQYLQSDGQYHQNGQ